MRLFLTNSEFSWQGVSRPGVPFLCDREMELEGLIRVRDEVIAGLQKQLIVRDSKPKTMPLNTKSRSG